MLGLGTDSLRMIDVNEDYSMNTSKLLVQIKADIEAGFKPMLVVASAGSVNTGGIDDFAEIAKICREQSIWMHVDGAFGGLARLAPEFKDKLASIDEADSVAFDFHKWLHVPYDAGCVLIKNHEAHKKSFASRREYLASGGGLAGGDLWFCDYGPELSRGFRALKVWFTIRAHGIDKLGAIIAQNCDQARYLASLVDGRINFELMSPVTMNVVCFRFVPLAALSSSVLDDLNSKIVAELQIEGIAAPSTTRLGGKMVIRSCVVNHRTKRSDLKKLVEEIERIGITLSNIMKA
jgi:glutamate/tyrosine decarboxylase-like PLP-dependent enzyme